MTALAILRNGRKTVDKGSAPDTAGDLQLFTTFSLYHYLTCANLLPPYKLALEQSSSSLR